MLETKDHEVAAPPFPAEGENPSAKFSSPYGLLAGSILLGAIIIAYSLFYNTQVLVKNSGGALSAPSQKQNVGQNAGTQSGQNAAAPARQIVTMKIKTDTPFLGSKDAKVTVVEFADYQCPFCEQFFSSVMPQLKKDYVDSGKIKFYYQDFAFLGPDSTVAAQAAHCAADQNQFWPYHDYLFSHQGQENSGWAAVDKQKGIAKTLGLNTAQFNQCLDSQKYSQEVQSELAAAQSYGVSGTPSLYIIKNNNWDFDISFIQNALTQRQSVVNLPNGNVFIVGVQPESVFAQAIDAASGSK